MLIHAIILIHDVCTYIRTYIIRWPACIHTNIQTYIQMYIVAIDLDRDTFMSAQDALVWINR